jgi:hypothetical protein
VPGFVLLVVPCFHNDDNNDDVNGSSSSISSSLSQWSTEYHGGVIFTPVFLCFFFIPGNIVNILYSGSVYCFTVAAEKVPSC